MRHRLGLLSLVLIFVLLIAGQVLALDEEYSGELEDDKDEDTYTIELDADDGVVITASAARGSDLDTVLSLENSDGDEVAYNDDYDYPDSTDSQIIYIAEDDDEYTIIVSPYSESSGAYDLTIEYVSREEAEALIAEAEALDEDEIDTTPARDPDEEYSGTILDDDDTDEYPFDLNVGESLIGALYAEDDSMDTYLTVVDPNGVEIVTNDDRGDYSTLDSQVAFTAEIAGEYILVVDNYPGSPGDYRLEVYFASAEEVAFAEQALRVVLTGAVETIGTEHFLIHYTTEGNDAVEADFVDSIAETIEEVYQIQIVELGWAIPPSDITQGGDGRIDVYITNIDDAYGYADSSSAGGDNPNTALVEENAVAGFLVLDNDYSEYDDPLQAMRATAAHEFHHVIQFGYEEDDMSLYYEATASWMETVTFPDDEEATIYVDDVFQYPEVCFAAEGDADESGYGVYGTWLFFEFMQRELGDVVVMELWENVALYDGWEVLITTLDEYDQDMPDFIGRYHVNNLVRDYAFVDSFDESTVWLEEAIDDMGTWTFTGEGIQELGANYFEFSPDEGLYEISLDGSRGDLQLYVIAIDGNDGEVFELEAGGVFDNEGYDEVYIMVFNRDYDDSLDSCRYIDYEINVDVARRGSNPVAASYEVDASNFEALN